LGQILHFTYLPLNVISGSVAANKLFDSQTRLETTKAILGSEDDSQIGDQIGGRPQLSSIGF
jgi:hypothetical protein